ALEPRAPGRSRAPRRALHDSRGERAAARAARRGDPGGRGARAGGAPSGGRARRLRACRRRSVRERAPPRAPRTAALARGGDPGRARAAAHAGALRRSGEPGRARAAHPHAGPRPDRRPPRGRVGARRPGAGDAVGPPAHMTCGARLAAVVPLVALGALACREPERTTTIELWAMGREGEVVREMTPDFERRHPGV